MRPSTETTSHETANSYGTDYTSEIPIAASLDGRPSIGLHSIRIGRSNAMVHMTISSWMTLPLTILRLRCSNSIMRADAGAS